MIWWISTFSFIFKICWIDGGINLNCKVRNCEGNDLHFARNLVDLKLDSYSACFNVLLRHLQVKVVVEFMCLFLVEQLMDYSWDYSVLEQGKISWLEVNLDALLQAQCYSEEMHVQLLTIRSMFEEWDLLLHSFNSYSLHLNHCLPSWQHSTLTLIVTRNLSNYFSVKIN